MVNQHEEPPFGRICFTFSSHLKQIQVDEHMNIEHEMVNVVSGHVFAKSPYD